MIPVSRILLTGLLGSSIVTSAQSGNLFEPSPRTVIAVNVDRSRFIDMPAGARTIAVGNPAIADALIAGNSLVLTGKAPGTTNLLAADEGGRLLLSAEISVTTATSGVIRLYRGTERRMLHCAPLCEPIAAPGGAAPIQDSMTFSNINKNAGGMSPARHQGE